MFLGVRFFICCSADAQPALSYCWGEILNNVVLTTSFVISSFYPKVTESLVWGWVPKLGQAPSGILSWIFLVRFHHPNTLGHFPH